MIDHLVYATPDLDATVVEMAERLAVEPVTGGSHPGLGTRNALVGLGGTTYLEIIGPDPEQLRPDGPRPFGIDDLDGATLVTWAARSAGPIAAVSAAAIPAGHDPGPGRAMSRRRPDGIDLRWQLTAPVIEGPLRRVVPFLIDWGTTAHPTDALVSAVMLVTLRLVHPEPARLHGVLAAIDAVDRCEIVEGPIGLSALLRTPHGVLQIS